MVGQAHYCPRCRIGTLDQNGVCVLCGQPAQEATGWRRVAESAGGVLSGTFSPVVLAVILFVALVAGYALLFFDGVVQHSGPSWAHQAAPSSPANVLASLRTDPAGSLLRLLAPALLQAVVFGLLLLLLLYVVRRRQAPAAPREDQRAFGA